MTFEIGDRVRYTDDFASRDFAWLRSSRGTVRDLERRATCRLLVHVQWDGQSDMTPEDEDRLAHVDAVERLANLA